MAPKLSPEGRRLQTIIVTVPIIAATSCEYMFCLCKTRRRGHLAGHIRRSSRCNRSLPSFSSRLIAVVLYKRLVLGEPQRSLPRPDTVYPSQDKEDRRIIPLKTVAGKTEVGAGSTGGGDEDTLMKE